MNNTNKTAQQLGAEAFKEGKPCQSPLLWTGPKKKRLDLLWMKEWTNGWKLAELPTRHSLYR